MAIARRNIMAGFTPRAPRRRRFAGRHRANEVKHGARLDPHHHVLHQCKPDLALAVDEEGRRNRDTAFFVRVEHAPFDDRRAVAIGEQRKRNRQILAHPGRPLGRIDRNCHNLGAGLAEVMVDLRIIRQLAEAEWSPMSSIEEDDAHRVAGQFRELTRSAGAIGQGEIRSGVADDDFARVILGWHPITMTNTALAEQRYDLGRGWGSFLAGWSGSRKPARSKVGNGNLSRLWKLRGALT